MASHGADCSYDVLVVGSGIAGVSAAIEAARAGARVCLATQGKLFGGSSFFPGTWGLGLIAPTDDAAATWRSLSSSTPSCTEYVLP